MSIQKHTTTDEHLCKTTLAMNQYSFNNVYVSLAMRTPDGKLTDARCSIVISKDRLREMVDGL